MRLLENRVAVITGSTRGIGLAVAHTFADHGASVVITGTDLEKAEAEARSAIFPPHRVHALHSPVHPK